MGYETLDEEVGETRAKQMFPFTSFIQHGATLAFGTDTPVVLNVTPFETMYFAVARQTVEGLPEPALMPEQRISAQEALMAHTNGAAKSLSRLDIGNFADFVILSKNFLDESPEEILKTQVVATYINGKKVFERH